MQKSEWQFPILSLTTGKAVHPSLLISPAQPALHSGLRGVDCDHAHRKRQDSAA